MPSFDLAPYFISLKGKQYLPVAPRVAWLREDHPDAVVTTEIIEHDAKDQWVIVRATIVLPSGGVATGMALQRPTTIAVDYIANGETSAIGRALANLGYGTLHALELEQGEQVVDSPVARPTLQTSDGTATTSQRAWYLESMAKLGHDKAKAHDIAEDVGRNPFERVSAIALRDVVAAAKEQALVYGEHPQFGTICWRIAEAEPKR